MSVSSSLRSLFRVPDFTRRPIFKFIANRSGPFEGTVELDRNRVYILPTKIGILFFLMILLLLLGSINSSKSLGFMLTFLLVGLGNIAMFSTWRNLAGLRLRSGGSPPVFLGESAIFAVQLENTDPQIRYSIAITREGREYEIVDVPADGVALVHFEVETNQRGFQDAGRFRLHTEFPAGLFVAWTWIELSMQCLVYPKPAASADMFISNSLQEGERELYGAGMEEYTGLRKYQPGDSWRRISWKAVARTHVLHVKEFAGGQPRLQWIEWDSLGVSGVEHRLSLMARLVIDAENAGSQYGLRLPGIEIMPDHGKPHYHHCLKALALYER